MLGEEGVKPELDRIHWAAKRWQYPLEDRFRYAPWELSSPAEPDVLARAERDLGFELPPLLRAIYTRVGNGGWLLELIGLPGGLMGRDSPFTDLDVVAAYRLLVEAPQQRGKQVWPRAMLPVWSGGCPIPKGRVVQEVGIACVDCSTREGQVVWENAFGRVLGSSTLVEYVEKAIEGYSPV